MTEHEKFEKERKDYQNKIRLAIEASKDERKTTDFKNLNPDNICLLLEATNNFTDNKSVSDNEITGELAKDFLIDKDSLDSALSEIKKRQPKKNFYKTINLKGLYDYLNDSVYCVKKEQGSYSDFAEGLIDEHYEKYNLTRFDDEFDKDDDFSVYKEFKINALSFLASEGFIQRIEKINTELVSGEKTEDYALVNDDGYVYARDNFYIVELFKENATGRSYYISLSKSREEWHGANPSQQIFALRKQEAEKFIADTDIQIEKPLFLNSNEPQKNIYISGKITGVENFAEIFASKEQELTQQGHNVFNPAKHPDMFSWQQFMELDLKALSFCDSIYMMNGWETSRGAKLELEEAKKLGLEIIYESPEQNISIEQNVGDESLKSISEIEERKNELSPHAILSKDYVRDFEDKLSDDSLSDSDLIEIAKTYIQELQNLHQSPEHSADKYAATQENLTSSDEDFKADIKIHHVLKKEDIENLQVISDEDFSNVVDSILLNDYRNIPNVIRLPNIQEGLAEKLGLDKDSAFILKKSAAHIRPDRKGIYGQAFDAEEYRMIPSVIRNSNFAVIDKALQNYQLVFDDQNNESKINKIIFDKDELGNYLVTVGKVDRDSAFSEERNIVVAVGVAPTIQTLRTRASSTALRASATTIDSNIAQSEENNNAFIQSFNPYKVWDRTDENEQVFKDWFEENKKNLTEKDLTNFNLSSVFSLANYLEEVYKFKVPEFGTALGSQGMAKVLMPFVEEAKSQSPSKVLKEELSVKEISEPQKKGIGYKVFYLRDGKLYPPMVQNPNGEATPMNSWIEASAGEVAGKTTTGRPQVKKGGRGTHSSPGFLAYRPGWHLGDVPIARQFSKTNPENGLKELFPAEFVWAECEYAADVDYQKEAMANGYTENGAFRHSYAGLQKLPENGSYRYRTNPDPNTEEWIITGKIKVNRILSNDEVDELCRKAGKEPQKREPGNFDEVEKEFIKKLGSEFSKTKNIDESFSNAIKSSTTADIAKFDSIVKVKLGEKYSRSDLMKYLEEKVASKDKLMEKNRSEPYERGR